MVAGCAPSARAPESSTTTTTSYTFEPVGASPRAAEGHEPVAEKNLSDAQILGIVREANAWEIDLATMAKRRASRSEVKEIAGLMFRQHNDAQMSARALGARTNIAPAESETSRMLYADVAGKAKSMRDASGDDFDRFFVDTMVRHHHDLLALIDQGLVPNATNGELKLYLVELRQRAALHLARLEEVQSSLGRVWGAPGVEPRRNSAPSHR